MALLLATALAALASVVLVRPAAAHDYLVGSVPEQGTTVETAPSEVALEFNTSIGEQFAQVAVIDDAGTTYQVGEPVVDGPTVTQAVDGLQPGTAVTISYRVVSSDGHPIGGTVPFTVSEVAGGEAPPPTPTPEPVAGETGVETDGETATTADTTESTSADSTTETAATSNSDSATVSPAVWVAAVAVAVLLAWSALTLSRRRSRTPTSP